MFQLQELQALNLVFLAAKTCHNAVWNESDLPSSVFKPRSMSILSTGSCSATTSMWLSCVEMMVTVEISEI